jgi:hypothetical protein
MESKIYRSQGENTNHYTTYSVAAIVTSLHLFAYKRNTTGLDELVLQHRVVTTKLMAYVFYQALPVVLVL